jgi:hypothetical protein
MARETLETLHPEWIGTKPGFGERDVDRVRSMIEERACAGLTEPAAEKVELTPDGFVFSGEPVTLPGIWQTLIDRLTPEQLQTAKSLA